MSHARLRDAVFQALGRVLDPELDAPLTELGFIHAVDVDDGAVRVALRLPTYWCSANFAYLMGEDIVAAMGAVAGVETVEVALIDHFAARRVNRGLAEGKSFSEAFGAEAAGDLGDVRADFRDKAFLARQAAVIQAMRSECDPQVIVSTTVTGLEARSRSAAPVHARQVERYLEARRSRPAAGDLAFLTLGGEPIEADGLLDHLREARRVSGSMAANGELCRMLLEARYGPKAAPSTGAAAAAAVDEQHHDDDDAVDHLAERFVHLHNR